MKLLIFTRRSSARFQRKVFIGLGSIVLITFVFSSCWKDRFDFNNISGTENWNPDVCAPLVHSQLSLRDILDDYDHNNLFVEDATHFLYLVYRNKVFSQTASELIQIPAQNLNSNFQISVPGSGVLWGNFTLPSFSQRYSFAMPQNEMLDKLVLNDPGGLLVINITSPNLNHDASINITIPAATTGGVALNKTFQYTSGLPLIDTIDLSGYQILFGNAEPDFNSIDIIYTLTVRGTGGQNNSPYDLSFSETFGGLSFHELYGDFKQQTFSMPFDSVSLKIFSNNIYGMMEIENPSISVWAYNSYGLPVGISLNNFRAISAVNPPYMVTLTGYPNPWIVDAPGISEIGQTYTSTFTLDNNNSGGTLAAALNMSPQWFIVDLQGQTNPAGGPSSNFVVDTSRIALDVQVELPLFGKAWNFCLGDTLDFSFNTNLDHVEYISFRLNTNNGFPVDATFQIYFLDEANHPVDSLFTTEEAFIMAAPVGPGPEYRVTSPASKLTTAVIDQTRMNALKSTRKLVIVSRLQTSSAGTQVVKIYSDYSVEVNLAARAKFKINP